MNAFGRIIFPPIFHYVYCYCYYSAQFLDGVNVVASPDGLSSLSSILLVISPNLIERAGDDQEEGNKHVLRTHVELAIALAKDMHVLLLSNCR